MKLATAAAFLVALACSASGGVTTSATAPTADILSSIDDGVDGIDTALFSEAVNPNHARGQLFSLPAGAGTEYEITAITIKKSNTQAYANDTITLRIFEGTSAQWDTGSGHSTVTDGSDYYVDTTVTPLHAETFTLSGSIANNDFVTFELATPLTVNEDSDFGFFMTYEQVGGTQDRFRHRENNNGGRLSITTTDHGVSSRNVVYYVQGSATTGGGPALVANTTAPGTGPVSHPTFGSYTTTFGTSSANPYFGRGQSFTCADTGDANTRWSVTELALRSKAARSFGTGDKIRLWVFEWLPSNDAGSMGNWTTGDGLSDGELLDGTSMGDVLVNGADYTLPASIANGDYLHFGFNLPLELDENSAYGAFFEFIDADGGTGDTDVRLGIGAGGSSSIEGWMPLELAGQFPHFDEMLDLYQSIDEYRSGTTISSRISGSYSSNLEAITDLTTKGWSTTNHDIFMRTRPNIIYNKMIHPMRCYGISGFIWYQGEANASNILNCAQYGFTLPDFVTEYRERFDQGNLPFLGVQLPSFNQSQWPWFRESQDQLATLNNGHVAVTIDTGLSGNIHPPDKEPIGIRLSLLARKYALGESIEAHGPRFDSMAIAGNQVTASFTNAAGLATDDALSPATFELAGADQVFHAATSSSISGSDVIISSTLVPAPVAVRYAWSPAPVNQVNLVNSDGLPAAPFRTDSWPLPGLGAQAPESIDDSYEIPGDQTLNVPSAGVLENDIDLNRDALTASLVADVTDGTLSLLADGSFTYTPHSGFAGIDSFSYRCSDGGLHSAAATVIIPASETVDGKLFVRLRVSE